MIARATPGAYNAATRSAGIIDRSAVGRIVVSGADRATYLQGLLTNDVAALKRGEGCYAAYLTAQGRMIADMNVFELGDVMLLTMSLDVKDAVLAKLNQFIFAEDVQLGDVTDTFSERVVAGPLAAQVAAKVLSGVDSEELQRLLDSANLRTEYNGNSAIIVVRRDVGLPAFGIIVERGLTDRLERDLQNAGAASIDQATADVLRIEAGVPLFHRDMDEDTIPLEAGIETRAISFTKGCYVGQEIIIRVMHRGHGRVARKLVGLVLDEAASFPDRAPVSVDGREIGFVTSAAVSPALHAVAALGYVHRDFVEPGTEVSIGGQPARVSAVPFVAPSGTS